MINLLALSLVLSSLATSCLLSPGQQTQTPKDDVVIVKGGHRVVIVEYDKEGGGDGNTKVKISPPPETHFSDDDDKTSYISTAKDKVSTAATTAKETVEDAKEKAEETFSEAFSRTGGGRHGPRELVCDALGKCTHRIASAMGKAKEKVSEKAHEVEEQGEEAIGEGIGKAEETLSQATSGVSEIAKETAEKAKTMVKDVENNVSTTIESAKEKTKDKVEEGKETVEKVAVKAKTGGNRVKEVGEKLFKETLRRCQQVVAAAALDWMVGVVHLLGFSAAYGICLWVTFVSSHVLAGTLPRQQFGMAQSRIYPVYFRVMAFSVGVALVGHLLGRREKLFTSKGEMLQGFYQLASLLMILVNSFYLEPEATKVMFEKVKLEKEEGRGREETVSDTPATPATETISTLPLSTPEKLDRDEVKSRNVKLNERLKKLNTRSSLLNIFTLVALTWHLVYLGQRLHLSC